MCSSNKSRKTSQSFRRSIAAIVAMSMFLGVQLPVVGADMVQRPSQPNIVFIMADDMGRDWVSCYGAAHETPHIDRLAQQGVRFENVWCNPICTPTRLTLLTGMYPFRTGWTDHHDVPRWGGKGFDWEQYVCWARVLRDAGYNTAIGGKWQVNDFREYPDVLLRHGFDEHCMWTGYETGNAPPSDERYWNAYLVTNGKRKVHEGEFGPTVVNEFLVDFIKRHKDRPFAVYYPMLLPHGPQVPTPLNKSDPPRAKAELYAGMVTYVDELVGRVVQTIDELGLAENTIIIFTCDNGSSTAGRLRGEKYVHGKGRVTDAGAHVPFVVRAPFLTGGDVPRTTKALVDFTDVYPTLVEAAGGNMPAHATFDGRSIAPLLDASAAPDAQREWIYSQRGDGRMVRDKQYLADNGGGLFDLLADPLQKNDLRDSTEPEHVAARRRLNAVLAKMPADGPSPFAGYGGKRRARQAPNARSPNEKQTSAAPPRPAAGKALQAQRELGPRLTSAQARPNVLFLLADDQRPDTVGAFGHPLVQTPNLDRIVHGGFRFSRNYCMGSMGGAVCVPSRAMINSGRTLFHVKNDLAGVKTMPEAFREAGYTTFGTGKWHNQAPSFLRSFEQGKAVFFGGMCDHTRVPLVDTTEDGQQINRRMGEAFSSTLFADAAIEFLQQQSGERPFYAYVAFTAPHDPRQAPEGYIDMYQPRDVPLPMNFMPQHPFFNGWMTGRDESLAPWPRTPLIVRHQLAEYYGLLSHMDFEVGRILDALEQSGQADNTIIVYAADHGLALGSHGLLGKQNLYEHSMGAPLVISGPGIPQGQSSPALTYLLDIFPTLCELTGVAAPEGVEGLSLAPIWRGEKQAVRDSVYTAYEKYMRAVRDERFKLIRYAHINKTQLFDLANDPDELNNLAEMPEHADRVERFTVLLADWQQRVDDELPLTSADPQSADIDLTGRKREPDRHQPDWIVKKYYEPQGREE